MPRLPRESRGGRAPGGRSLRGATPAQRSRVFNDEGNKLLAPSIQRYGGPVPQLDPFPSLVELGKLNVAQLGEILDRYGITEPWPQQRAAQVGYLSRISKIPSGTPQFEAELQRLLDFDSKQGLLMAARRANHEYAKASFGRDAKLIRICEDDDASCETCIRLGGTIGTVAEQEAIGWVGAASCDGGDRCRCEYAEYE